MEEARTYIAIDLKSFYASVECVERGLDALTTHLVVADASRTDKTICLAVSPSLKAYGLPGRARLFEVIRQVAAINEQRRQKAPGRRLEGKSFDSRELAAHPNLALDYIVATPQMAHYMAVSGEVYATYLKYVSAEDVHVYSVDEVFIDATQYLRIYKTTAHDFARTMIRDVLATTGITATAGIGPNLYLAKIAMDIEAKHQTADADGVRIAELDEMAYRRKYWSHRPLTDFWRVGHGIAARLEANGMFTMGDVARASLGQPYQRLNEDLLYKLFGVNAELLIDHAWGWEPCTMADIKKYRPSANSMSIGQVLMEPYDHEKARLIVKEMTDQLVLDLGYDGGAASQDGYQGEMTTDWYGRKVPKSAHGSARLDNPTSSTTLITKAMMEIYDRVTDPSLKVRRIYVIAAQVIPEEKVEGIQLGLFEEPVDTERERSRQEAILAIRRKFGKNAILKGMNFEDGATARDRNQQIGGHKA